MCAALVDPTVDVQDFEGTTIPRNTNILFDVDFQRIEMEESAELEAHGIVASTVICATTVIFMC